jgi:hypothetical protein
VSGIDGMAAIVTDTGDWLVTDSGDPIIWTAPMGSIVITRARPEELANDLGVLELVEGWTGPLDFHLVGDGEPASLHGCDVTFLLGRGDGTEIEREAEIRDPGAGLVRWSPDPTDLVGGEAASTLRVRVVDAAGRKTFWPSGRALTVRVRGI